jgi:hypothetical protein
MFLLEANYKWATARETLLEPLLSVNARKATYVLLAAAKSSNVGGVQF